MAKFTSCIRSLTNFSVIDKVINLNAIEKITIEIESNSDKHSLVLIKPWPPFSRPSSGLDKVSGLSAQNIESVCPAPPSPSDKPGIEITMKNEDGIIIRCDSIEYSI